MSVPVLLMAVVAFWPGGGVRAAEPARSWTLTNHAHRYENELVRLGLTVPAETKPGEITVIADGRPVAFQLEPGAGPDGKADRSAVWVTATIDPKASCRYVVAPRASKATGPPAVTVGRDDDAIYLNNGRVAVKLPRRARGESPPPVLGVGRADVNGKVNYRGQGNWSTPLELKSFSAEVLAEGPLFARVRLRYEFKPAEGIDEPFAEAVVTLPADRPYVEISETHRMTPDSAWTFDASAGWGGHRGLVRRWFKGPFDPAGGLEAKALKPSQRLGDTLIYLQPRWTQSYDHGWFFAAGDGREVLGALVLRAGRWRYPHDNLLAVKVDASGKLARLRCPTHRGSRYFVLLAGPRELIEAEGKNDPLRSLAYNAGMAPLDKLTHEYILDWPGVKPGGFSGQFFYSNMTNPTGPLRQIGRRAVAQAKKGRSRPSRSNLSTVQVYLDPDFYGSYWDYWSPINPNFYTDFIRLPIAKAAMLKGHPRFREFAKMAQRAFRTDLYHSVTLPGGAGQECPGYTAHAMKSWAMLAPVCKQHLGFDPTSWPRYQAAASFLLRTSQPLGGGKRRILPLGDTHPTGPDVIELARKYGAYEDPTTFVSEELPGFGAVLRSHSGTGRENFLAFKAGPNRGHNHGDQLSFHYCGDGRRLAIDHMCSYSPRPDQEHMHNRVAFSTGDWPYANMDGYERLIALETSDVADIAVGQVESDRLRKMPKLPPCPWNPIGPYKPLAETLTYRRTIVMVKNPAAGRGKDYYVLRDQHHGPDLTATYCLHVESDKAQRSGNRVDFGTMTLFVAAPREADYERFDWSFQKGRDGYSESTVGVRFSRSGSASQFITVLYPDGDAPAMSAIANGVRLDFKGGHVDEVVFGDAPPSAGGEGKGPLVVVRRDGRPVARLSADDVDLDRPQGKVGLFVPDCGYDFGPIPDWLLRQRTTRPAFLDD
jgi:hypothetical protein